MESENKRNKNGVLAGHYDVDAEYGWMNTITPTKGVITLIPVKVRKAKSKK